MSIEVKDQIRRSVWLGLSTILLLKAYDFIFEGEPLHDHLLTSVLAAVVLMIAAFGLDRREEWHEGKRWTW